MLTLAVGYVFVKVLARRAPRRPHLTVAATGDVDLGEGGIPPEPAVGPDLDPDGRRLGATRRVRAFGSAWIDMNLLSINPNLVVVDRDQTT